VFDWGHAKDYVEAMWKMMQKKIPSDYVISTGKQHTVKQFVNFALNELNIKYYWKGKGGRGKGSKSKCFDKNANCIIECDKEYFRPLEVDTLLGDSKKARKELKWKPKTNIKTLVKEMVNSELTRLING
jgi:GDPmannose 4,6-dehydratase